MKQLFHLEDRKLLISMIALSLIALLAAVLLNLAMTAYTNQALKDTYAGIVGTVAQKYPQAEAQVVQDLRAPDALSVNLGHQVLGKYGLGDRSAARYRRCRRPAGAPAAGRIGAGRAGLRRVRPFAGSGTSAPYLRRWPGFQPTCARSKPAIIPSTCATTARAASAC